MGLEFVMFDVVGEFEDRCQHVPLCLGEVANITIVPICHTIDGLVLSLTAAKAEFPAFIGAVTPNERQMCIVYSFFKKPEDVLAKAHVHEYRKELVGMFGDLPCSFFWDLDISKALL